MLNQVLQEIERSQSTINLNDLSRKLGMERSALDGIIHFWVRKGRLRDDDADLALAIKPACSSSSCRDSCVGMAACPFVAKMPKTYSIPAQKRDWTGGQLYFLEQQKIDARDFLRWNGIFLTNIEAISFSIKKCPAFCIWSANKNE